MPRVKRGVVAHRRHKKVLKQAKGYYGARSRIFRVAKQAVTKAGQYAYRDRRQRKRQFRALWITRFYSDRGASEGRFGLSPPHRLGGSLAVCVTSRERAVLFPFFVGGILCFVPPPRECESTIIGAVKCFTRYLEHGVLEVAGYTLMREQCTYQTNCPT